MEGIIPAIIALCGVLVSTIISLIIAFSTTKFNYRQLFATTSSQSRKKWIDTITNCFAEYFAVAETLHNLGKIKKTGDCPEVDKIKREYQYRLTRYERMITQRFSINDDYQRLVKAAFLNMRLVISDASVSNEEFIAKCECLEDLGRQLLKIEWDIVKKETSGKIEDFGGKYGE